MRERPGLLHRAVDAQVASPRMIWTEPAGGAGDHDLKVPASIRRSDISVEISAGLHLEAPAAARRLAERYGPPSPGTSICVVVGGNSAVLKALHREAGTHRSVFGMALDEAEYLTNSFSEKDLEERISQAIAVLAVPLRVAMRGSSGNWSGLAFNDVAVFRQSRRMVFVRAEVNGRERVAVRGDGVLLSTPVGSTAYNRSVGGPILPLTARALAVTPIAPFEPRDWRGALLSEEARFRFRADDAKGASAAATADFNELRDVEEVQAQLDPLSAVQLLFDRGDSLGDRQLLEQFKQPASTVRMRRT